LGKGRRDCFFSEPRRERIYGRSETSTHDGMGEDLLREEILSSSAVSEVEKVRGLS